MWKIAIDTGGTFTDCYGSKPDGSVFRFKVLSDSVLRGTVISEKHRQVKIEQNWPIKEDIFHGYIFKHIKSGIATKIESCDFSKNIIFLEGRIARMEKGDFFEITANEEAPILATRLITKTSLTDQFPLIQLHIGTTKGTNAILEKKGAKTGVFLTKGFQDLMVIDNQQRPNLFQLNIPDRTLYYDAVYEVDERIDAKGNAVKSCSINQHEISAFIQSNELESIAISLVNSYQNPDHERQIAESLTGLNFENISVSHKLSPTIHYLKRSKTTVINAYLKPIIQSYISGIQNAIKGSRTYIMKSSGGLIDANRFVPKDSLLSGPAGGIVGAANIAKMLQAERLIAFDMGGTSTDVARYDNQFDYVDELKIGEAILKTPAMNIHTVAAGGGSIISYANGNILVGPESAGANPGPACYGAGGPLTITDVNLLLGKIDPVKVKIPLDLNAARDAMVKFKLTVGSEDVDDKDFLQGIERIANEKMAQAIRKISVAKGFDPSDYILCGFGGAGGLHVCSIADVLEIDKIVIPYDAGILSAFGIYHAPMERMAQLQVLQLLEKFEYQLMRAIGQLESQVISDFEREGISIRSEDIKHHFVYLRLKGQADTIELDVKSNPNLRERFKIAYENRFGYYPSEGIIEIERIVVVAQKRQVQDFQAEPMLDIWSTKKSQKEFHTIDHTQLKENDRIEGPVILSHPNSTAFIDSDWEGVVDKYLNVVLKRKKNSASKGGISIEAIRRSLFTNRFMAIAEEMGNQLQRTSFSVNIRERLDFSCAILDPQGRLLVNAPHIPVHLGSLGICGRLMMEHIDLNPGDVLLTNHPKYGGSHLPDLTLLSGAFTEDGKLIAYLINRAHHAEIGGSKPGSMPPDAKNLAEEGIVFLPTYLVRNGQLQEDNILEALNRKPYPSRLPEHNMADLKAGIASLESGRRALIALAEKYSLEVVHNYMAKLMDLSRSSIQQHPIIQGIHNDNTRYLAIDKLDDGHEICVAIYGKKEKVVFDFSGSSAVHPDNLNANISIIYSAVLYVLRLLLDQDLPLNEGLLANVQIKLPEESFLHPRFVDNPQKCPAVVGGNTEVSQRIVDTLIKALGLAACSQGTMNNFLFGNKNFGYYETIAGGVGAGPNFNGRSGSHQHMTNTRITDVEELEHNYPVLLNRFELREHSGGLGKYKGGEGVLRELTFLEDVEMTLIGQHRIIPPYGIYGGQNGKLGEQHIIKRDGTKKPIQGIVAMKMKKGEKIHISTPGGGGYGKP